MFLRIRLFLVVVPAILMSHSPLASTQSVEKIKKSEATIREEMLQISRELGVTCGECHNLQNFRSDEKKNFKVSLDHMRITALLKEQGFDGKRGPEASCFLCHKGQLKFEHKPPAQ